MSKSVATGFLPPPLLSKEPSRPLTARHLLISERRGGPISLLAQCKGLVESPILTFYGDR